MVTPAVLQPGAGYRRRQLSPSLTEPIQLALLGSLEHFPTDRKMHPAPYHATDQRELVFMISAAVMRLADVDHICVCDSGPELPFSCRLLSAGWKFAKSIGTEAHSAENQQPQ